MFVEHKEALEVTEAPVKTLKLSEAIRKGHEMIEEFPGCYLRSGRGCALGAMWLGMGRTEKEWRAVEYSGTSQESVFAVQLGISGQLASEISSKHYRGMRRLAIADWLEARGL